LSIFPKARWKLPSFRFSRVVAIAYLRLLEVFRGAPSLFLELPENISAPRLQRVWSMIFSIKDFSLAVDE